MLVDAGKACAAYHDATVRNVSTRRVQVDEIWTFTAAKQKNVGRMKAPVEGAGDTWTWTAIDADSKLVVTWLIGGRDGDYACPSWTTCGCASPTAFNSRRTDMPHTSMQSAAHSVVTWTMRSS